MDTSSKTMVGKLRGEVIRELRKTISTTEKAINRKEKLKASDLYLLYHTKESLKEQSKRLFEFKELQEYALNIIKVITELEQLMRNTSAFQSKLIEKLDEFERTIIEVESIQERREKWARRKSIAAVEGEAKPVRISSDILDLKLAEIKHSLEVLFSSYEEINNKLKELTRLDNIANGIVIKMNVDFTFIIKSIKNVEKKLRDIEVYSQRLENFLKAEGRIIGKKSARIILPVLPKINLLIKEDKSMADEVYIINSIGAIRTKLAAYKLYTPTGKSIYDTLMEDLLLLDKLHKQLSQKNSDANKLLQNLSHIEELGKGNELGAEGKDIIEREINLMIRQVEIELEEISELAHRIRKNMAIFEHTIAYFEKILNFITEEQDKRVKELPNIQEHISSIIYYLKKFGLIFSEEIGNLEEFYTPTGKRIYNTLKEI